MAIIVSDQASAAFDDLRNDPENTRYCIDVASDLDSIAKGNGWTFNLDRVEQVKPPGAFARASRVVITQADGEVALTELLRKLRKFPNWTVTISGEELIGIKQCVPLVSDDEGSAAQDGSES